MEKSCKKLNISLICFLLLSICEMNAQPQKLLKAQKDTETRLWGYENVGVKAYWWKEAHSQGRKEELLNYGYNTEWDISAQYDKAAKEFSEGLAGVELHGYVGFIDTNNRFIITPQFDPVDKLYGYNHGLAAVKYGGKYGFINKKGEFIIPAIFDYAENFDEHFLATVKLMNKFGAIDLKGDTIVACRYLTKEAMKLLPFKNKEYRDAVKMVETRRNEGYYEKIENAINNVAKEIDSLIQDNTYSPTFTPSFIVPSHSKFGLKCKNTDTEWRLRPTYDSIASMGDGLYLLYNENKQGVADTYGRVLLPCKFKEVAYQANEKLIIVRSPSNKRTASARIGIYNCRGAMVLPCVLDSISSFSKGFATAKIGNVPITIDRNGMVNDDCINQLLSEGQGKSLDYYRRIIGLRPTCAQAHNNIGIHYLELKMYKEGMASLKMAHTLCPSDKTISENLEKAKADRKERRYNRVINVLNTVSTVTEVAAATYSAATGMSSENGFNHNVTQETSSGKSGTSYESQYRMWERRAESNYRSLTNLGYSSKDKDGNLKGSTRKGKKKTISSNNYTQQKKAFREAQKEMRQIRQKARKAGVKIPQSKWETATISY